MQPWTEAYADILIGLAVIAAVAAVFIVLPLSVRGGIRAAERDFDDWTGNDQER